MGGFNCGFRYIRVGGIRLHKITKYKVPGYRYTNTHSLVDHLVSTDLQSCVVIWQKKSLKVTESNGSKS